MPRSISASMSALRAAPSRIQPSPAAPGPLPVRCAHVATYNVPAERSRGASATNMNRPPLSQSSPISTVRSSGMTCATSCEMRPMP